MAAPFFPIKCDSTGAIAEPSNLSIGAAYISKTANLVSNAGQLDTVQAIQQTSFVQFGQITSSSNATDYTRLIVANSSAGGSTWHVRTPGSGSSNTGTFEVAYSGATVGIRLATTGQPTFPFFSSVGTIRTSASGVLTVLADGGNNTFYGINGSGVAGYYTVSGTIAGLTTNGFTYANSSSSVASTAAATNGQLLIGSTGSNPVAASLTGTTNQVVVTPGAGSITLSLPQNINTAATPTFAGMTLTGALTPSSTAGIVGTTTNDNANTGSIGEYVSSTIASGSAVSLTTNVPASVTSISLSVGDWDVTGVIDFSPNASTTVSYVTFGISTSTANFSTQDRWAQLNAPGNGQISYGVCPTVRLSLSGTTTVVLAAQSGFTVSTMAAYGTIRARRIR